MGKLLFFDIDGTIVVDEDGSIPASAVRAIADARNAGHKTFINTGRTWGNIDPELRELGFDGFLCGCGTEIRYEDAILFYTTVDKSLCMQIRDLVRACNATPLYERTDTMFYDPMQRVLPQYAALMQIYERKKTAVHDLTACDHFSFDKFVIWYDEQTDLERFRRGTAPHFAYIDRGYGFAEMVPLACSKATAIQQIVQHLNADMQDTVAFGDSLNDLPMMQAVHTTVGMGNGTSLHPYVSFITKDIKEDGLAYAMEQLGLLSFSQI